MFWRQVMASESAGEESDRDTGHRNHFQLLQEQGLSWSGREPNTLFQNRGDGTFDEVGNVLGLFLRLDSRGPATADLDGDGDLELLVYNRNNPTIKIFRNDYPGQGRVLRVRLIGVQSELLAAGAQAELSCDGHSQLAQVAVGSGFLAQSEPVLTFGLGACAMVERLEVRWPSGLRQSWTELPADHFVTLTEGDDRAPARPLAPRNYNRTDLAVAPGELSARVPELKFDPVDETTAPLALAELGSETIVLNFWATWCTACRSEMPDLEKLHRELAGRGVRFYGISLDEGRPGAAVREFLAEAGVSYGQLWGTIEDQAPFASLGSSPPGAIPTTAVLHRGLVRHVDIGPIEPQAFRELLEGLLEE